MNIEINKSYPTEEGDYFYFNEVTGNVNLLQVVDHKPLQYASDKERKKYNPNDRNYFAVPSLGYRNVKGLQGTWSDKLIYKVPKIKLF
jgi:hypothetical protein